MTTHLHIEQRQDTVQHGIAGGFALKNFSPMDLRQVEIEAGRRYEIACTAKLTQCRAVDVP